MPTETQEESQAQQESQAQTTQETQEKSSQSEQHSETSQANESSDHDRFKDGIAEGQKRAEKKLAKTLGLDGLDPAKIKEALEFKHKADEAAKTAEQREAELGSKVETLSQKAEKQAALIASIAEEKFNSLSDEAKAFVVEVAGDDPEARMEYMAKESFQKLVAGTAKKGAQGGTSNTKQDGEKSDKQKAYEDAYAKSQDMSLSFQERQEASRQALRLMD